LSIWRQSQERDYTGLILNIPVKLVANVVILIELVEMVKSSFVLTVATYIAILNHSCRYVGAVPRVPALRGIGLMLG
jgi:hypothetical protein